MDVNLVIFITLIAALIASFSQLLFKRGTRRRMSSFMDLLRLAESKEAVVGGVGYLTSLAIYLFALSNAPLSIVYPIFASTFIFVALISFALLKEEMPARRVLGVLVVFAGILLVSLAM